MSVTLFASIASVATATPLAYNSTVRNGKLWEVETNQTACSGTVETGCLFGKQVVTATILSQSGTELEIKKYTRDGNTMRLSATGAVGYEVVDGRYVDYLNVALPTGSGRTYERSFPASVVTPADIPVREKSYEVWDAYLPPADSDDYTDEDCVDAAWDAVSQLNDAFAAAKRRAKLRDKDCIRAVNSFSPNVRLPFWYFSEVIPGAQADSVLDGQWTSADWDRYEDCIEEGLFPSRDWWERQQDQLAAWLDVWLAECFDHNEFSPVPPETPEEPDFSEIEMCIGTCQRFETRPDSKHLSIRAGMLNLSTRLGQSGDPFRAR